MVKTAEVVLEYQPYFDKPPVSAAQLHEQACANDDTTINSWLPQWIDQVKANHKKFGNFADHSIGQLHNKFRNMPCIVAGSGPSLKNNIHLLKDRGPNMALVSCLHNFHYMEDNDANVDLYVTLDAGEVVVEEVFEGGKHAPEYYWEKTKSKTLAAYIGTHPKLLEKWQGKILFYNCAVPSEEYHAAVAECGNFSVWVSNGGNVLGASMYIAKAYFGCNPIAYIGADFSFSYGAAKDGGFKFHSWDSKYDNKLGVYVKAVDIYGIPVKSWQSYLNFKAWFESIAIKVPGIWVNCSEGGCLGSYQGGNIRQIEQVDLSDFIAAYKLTDHLTEAIANPHQPPVKGQIKILF